MLPGIATLQGYGGALLDYSPPVDPTTDPSAAGRNPAFADIAAMTHVAPRAFARFALSGTVLAPVLLAHDETWNNGNPANVAPVVARAGVGIYTVTWPATVFDEIPAGMPGSSPAGFPVNLRGGWACASNVADFYDAHVVPTAPNVLTLYLWTFSGGAFVLADAPVAADPLNPASWLTIMVGAL
jgi:hypothetical protein